MQLPARFLLGLLVLTPACVAPVPLRVRLAPYPANGQTPGQFAADDSYCDYVARYQASGVPVGQGAATGAVGGAALGAAAGAIGGAGWGEAGYGAGVGAAAGGLGGLVAGAAADSANVDSVAVNNYRSCMASRGYVTQ